MELRSRFESIFFCKIYSCRFGFFNKKTTRPSTILANVPTYKRSNASTVSLNHHQRSTIINLQLGTFVVQGASINQPPPRRYTGYGKIEHRVPGMDIPS